MKVTVCKLTNGHKQDQEWGQRWPPFSSSFSPLPTWKQELDRETRSCSLTPGRPTGKWASQFRFSLSETCLLFILVGSHFGEPAYHWPSCYVDYRKPQLLCQDQYPDRSKRVITRRLFD